MHNIPASLRVNSDQTQLVYAQGCGLTWAPHGSKQVAVVGSEEKQAYMLLVSIAADGSVLPFQAIYEGSSWRSRPSESA